MSSYLRRERRQPLDHTVDFHDLQDARVALSIILEPRIGFLQRRTGSENVLHSYILPRPSSQSHVRPHNRYFRSTLPILGDDGNP